MKKILLLLVLIICQVLAANAQLTIWDWPSSICQGGTGNVGYIDTNTSYQATNVFTVQLSDAAGSFASPLAIGSMAGICGGCIIPVSVPSSVPLGTGYRMRVVASDPVVIGSANPANISVVAPLQVSAVTNSPVCQGFTLNLSVTQTPGATYSWTGPNGFTSAVFNPSITDAQPSDGGTYQVFVTANGCTTEDTVQVVVSPQPQAPQPVSTSPTCAGQTLMMDVVNPIPGGIYQWTGPNGFSWVGLPATIPNATFSASGTYQVTVTINGCTSPVGMVQAVVQPVPVMSLYADLNTICPGGSTNLTASGANSYSWVPGGSTSGFITVSPAVTTTYTLYGFNVSYPNCPAIRTTTITVTGSLAAQSNSPVQTLGTIYLTATAIPNPGQVVQWTGPNGFTATGTNVYIQNATPANAGVYTATLQGGICGTVTATTNVHVGPLNTVTGLVYNDANNNGTFDTGEAPIPNVVLELQPGGVYGITNALGQFQIAVTDGSYTLTAIAQHAQQTVSPASYTVSVSGGGQVSAGNNFGIYSPSVADLSVSLVHAWQPPIPGFTSSYFVNVFNLGTAAGSGVVRTVLPAGASLSGNTGGATISGDTLTWPITNLAPLGTISFSVSYQLPATAVLGSLRHFTAWVVPSGPDLNPANNVANLYNTVVGSYDPNDKQVSPVGPISPAQVAAGQELTYTIRFQNTGTFMAFNVMVADTLSQHLDVSTLQMKSASHNYNVSLRENGILEWHFPNIMLPDSNSNEPASHGYIQYSIKPKANLQLSDEIENTAHIFFDFNEAIVTNTTSTVVAMPNATAALVQENLLQVFPTPNTGNATLRLAQASAGEVQVRVLNLLGQEVLHLSRTAAGGGFEMPLDLQKQPAGIYLVQMRQGEKIYSAKLVRE